MITPDLTLGALAGEPLVKFRPEQMKNRPTTRSRLGLQTANIGDEDFVFLYTPGHRNGAEIGYNFEPGLSLPSDRFAVSPTH